MRCLQARIAANGVGKELDFESAKWSGHLRIPFCQETRNQNQNANLVHVRMTTLQKIYDLTRIYGLSSHPCPTLRWPMSTPNTVLP